MRYAFSFCSLTVAATICLTANFSRAGDAPATEKEPSGQTAAGGEEKEKSKLVPLMKGGKVWIDLERKLVAVDGRVCFRQGVLELFACPKGGKEHESIVAIDAPAFVVHAGLIRVGGKSGTPVEWVPEYKPATGMKIDIWVLWKDEDGMDRKVRAQQWIRDIHTRKAMTHDWIFAGSSFFKDEETGEDIYRADLTGDFICVSNFATATLDLPIKSSADNVDLLFEPFTERIPAIGTKVRLVLIPRPDEMGKSGETSTPSGSPADEKDQQE